jgi:hypothetical protein
MTDELLTLMQERIAIGLKREKTMDAIEEMDSYMALHNLLRKQLIRKEI